MNVSGGSLGVESEDLLSDVFISEQQIVLAHKYLQRKIADDAERLAVREMLGLSI